MNKVIIALLMTLLTVSVSQAQGKKSLKAASKALSEFEKDPFGNMEALAQAKSLLEEAFQDSEVSEDPRAWVTKGEIYSNIADSQIKAKLLNPEATLTDATAAVAAVDAFEKALMMADKADDKKAKKGAIKGLQQSEGLLNTVGGESYTSQDYATAYTNYAATIKASELLSSVGEASVLDDQGMKSEKNYFAGLTAFYVEDWDSAIKYLEAAKETGTSEGPLYQLLHEAHNKKGNDEMAYEYLSKGRELFPDDSGLLFSEINYFLGKGELDAMIDKLKEALANEPENISVIMTIGQVYEQLVNKAAEAGDLEKAEELAANASQYYEMVLEKEPDNFSATYSLGALYYNKAAALTPSLNEAADDLSSAGQKKYDEIKLQMESYFDKALPFFLKADELNDKDSNTLIALKEIYVRKGDFETSNKYKERLEAL